MKYLAILLLSSICALSQQTPAFTPARRDGSNITNPSGWRGNLGVPFIYPENYGVVYTASDDTTAIANAAALTTALAAAEDANATLFIRGTIYVSGQVLVEGLGIRVLGDRGATIIQKNIAHNGITLSDRTLLYGLIWDGVNIQGQGAATHDAAGIYGRLDARVNYLVGTPAASTTLTVNAVVYTYVSALTSGNQILIGASPTAMATNAAAALASHPDVNATVSASGTRVALHSKAIGAAITISTNANGAASTVETLPYIGSDVKFENCSISGFRKGTNLAGLAKLTQENLSIISCRAGQEWNHIQTYLLTNVRIVGGDSHADSTCFTITGGNFFAGEIIMGEFGGSGIARFASMTEGRLIVNSSNLETFTADQLVNLTGTSNSKYVEFRNCRISQSRTATQSLISSQASGANGLPSIVFENNVGWSGGRVLEIWGNSGASLANYPRVAGREVLTSYATTQGGTITQLRYEQSDRTHRVLTGASRASIASGTDVTVCTYAIPAARLYKPGQTLKMRAAGTTAANANNKHFKATIGTKTFDFGAIAMNKVGW